MFLPAVGADDEAALPVDAGGGALSRAARLGEGDPAAQVDAGGGVGLPVGRKALGAEGVQSPVETEVGQALGQPGGVGLQVHFGPLQGQRGAVGQPGFIKIALGLGQVDADAAEVGPAFPAGAVVHRLAEDAHHLFAPQQQVVGPLDGAFGPVPQPQLLPDGQAGKEGQGLGLDHGHLEDGGVVEGLPRRVDPAAAQTAPAFGLAGGVDRPHRAELLNVLFGVGVGAAAGGQAADLVQAHRLGTSLCSARRTRPSAKVRTP